MSKNILKNRRFYQKNVLKGEEYLQKEKRGIDNVLLLPITVVSSVFYYVACNSSSSILYILLYNCKIGDESAYAKVFGKNSRGLSFSLV